MPAYRGSPPAARTRTEQARRLGPGWLLALLTGLVPPRAAGGMRMSAALRLDEEDVSGRGLFNDIDENPTDEARKLSYGNRRIAEDPERSPLQPHEPLETLAGTCKFFGSEIPVVCGQMQGVSPCAVGGCPFEEFDKVTRTLLGATSRRGRWMVRAEPCTAKSGYYNPAWAGAHISLARTRAYGDAIGSFEKLWQQLKGNTRPWRPSKFNFTKATRYCKEEMKYGYYRTTYAQLVIDDDPFFHTIEQYLTNAGFYGNSGHPHVTVAFPGAWNMPAKYEADPTYQALVEDLKQASWHLVLVYFNGTSDRLDKPLSFELRQ